MKSCKWAKRVFAIVVAAGLAVLSGCETMPRHGAAPTMTRHAVAQLWQPADPENYELPYALDLSRLSRLDVIAEQLKSRRVVYVGEIHDRFDHHLNQLEVIRRLHGANPALAIGVEFFQQPFQPALDNYIAGKIDERTFLEQSEYYDRWRLDYRHYRPILQFARENAIPVIALHITDELRRRIAEVGIEGLQPEERKLVPEEIDRSNQEYAKLLRSIFHLHPATPGQHFERFMEVQLVRDEAMAQTAANYLKKHKKQRMVILAGGGHLSYGFGIPSRLQRRMKVKSAIVLNDITHEPEPDLADFILLPRPASLPPAGLLGVMLDTREKGTVRISSFAKDSPAEAAGMRADDAIIAIDGAPVASLVDIKYALLEKKPGEQVKVKVRRKGLFGSASEPEYELALQ